MLSIEVLDGVIVPDARSIQIFVRYSSAVGDFSERTLHKPGVDEY